MLGDTFLIISLSLPSSRSLFLSLSLSLSQPQTALQLRMHPRERRGEETGEGDGKEDRGWDKLKKKARIGRKDRGGSLSLRTLSTLLFVLGAATSSRVLGIRFCKFRAHVLKLLCVHPHENHLRHSKSLVVLVPNNLSPSLPSASPSLV